MIDILSVPGLSGHGVVVLAFTVLVFALLAWDRLPIQAVGLVVLVFLPLLFLAFPMEVDGAPLDPFVFFLGFGHQALIAICALMVLGRALVVTGALEPAARWLARLFAARPALALLGVLLASMLSSGFVNDTPIVVMMIPLLIGAAQRSKATPAQVLMPMNFAVLVGGMATTIGTSTNLIVVSMAGGLGMRTIGMFDFYPLVAIAAVPALLYLWLVAPRLLSHIPGPPSTSTEDVFEAELTVPEGSPLDGATVADALERTEGRMRVDEVRRDGMVLPARPRTAKLRAGDRIHIRDTAENLHEFARSLGAELHGLGEDDGSEQTEKKAEAGKKATGSGTERGRTEESEGKAEAKSDQAAPPHAERFLAQLIVDQDSPLVGSTLRRSHFADTYGLIVVGLRRSAGHPGWRRAEIADTVLRAGDLLLVQGGEAQLREAQLAGAGYALDTRIALPQSEKALPALLTLGAVVLAAATKILPIALAGLFGVGVLLALRALKWSDVGKALSLKVIFLVASSLALGNALALTGGTAFLAGLFIDAAGGLEPRWFITLLMLAMGALTNFVSNNAAAAIGTPLAFDMAHQLGVPPEPFVLAVLFGCNLCYVTPMGYQSNLLVMNAAGYRFGDFVRVGGPLFLLFGGTLAWVLVRAYGL